MERRFHPRTTDGWDDDFHERAKSGTPFVVRDRQIPNGSRCEIWRSRATEEWDTEIPNARSGDLALRMNRPSPWRITDNR